MTLAVEIAVGSSAQIALLVAPVLVLYSFAIGRPMSLLFNAVRDRAIALSVLATSIVVVDGESNWVEGLQLHVGLSRSSRSRSISFPDVRLQPSWRSWPERYSAGHDVYRSRHAVD